MKKFILIILLFISSSIYAATYYVDAVNGNDSNDGLSPATAWKSLSKVSEIRFSPGDFVKFKRGQVFIAYSTLKINGGTSGNPVTYGAYGDGNEPLPIITAVRKHSLTWTKIGENIWKTTSSFPVHPERLKKNGYEILRAQYDDELGKRVPALIEWQYKDGYILLYSTSDPNNDTFEYSPIMDTINIAKGGNIILENLDIRGGYRFSILCEEGDNITIQNMKIGSMCGEGFRYKGGRNLIIDNCIFDADWPSSLDYRGIPGTSARDSTTRGIQEATTMTGTASNITIKNSIFKNWMHASISIVPTTNYNGIKIYNNNFTAPDIAYGNKISISYDANNIEIYNNTFEKQYSGRIQTPSWTGTNLNIHHNIFRDMYITPMKDNKNWGFSTNITGAITSKTVIENNVIINSAPGAIKVCGGQTVINKNTIINSSTDYLGAIVVCSEDYGQYQTIITNNNIYSDINTNNAIFYKGSVYSIDMINNIVPKNNDLINGNYTDSTYSLEGVGCSFDLKPSEIISKTSSSKEEGPFIMDESGIR